MTKTVTPPEHPRISKMKRRLPLVRSQVHLDKIIGSFPEEHRKLAIEAISGILQGNLVAREPVEVAVQPKDPENPTLQESTVARLQAHSRKILEQADTLREMDKRIRELEAQNKHLEDQLNRKPVTRRTI